MTRRFAVWTLTVWLACFGAATGADGPSNKVPELTALDYYVGSWDTEITSQGLPFTKGNATAKWMLDGRFVQQIGEVRAQDGSIVFKLTTLMTYDPNKKAYRSWTFLSDGATSESEGTWDAKNRVMNSVGRKDENGGFSTTTADFSEAGVEKWKIIYTDRAGKVVSEVTGKNTRKKQ